MRKILSGLTIAFLIVFLNLMTSFIALIMIKESTPSSYQALDVAKQIDVSRETVRNVTAYNVGDPKQTHSRPCIGASGDNLCSLVKRGVNVCAANFVPLKSKLYVDKFGECIVLDRMNARFRNRVDFAMEKNEYGRAVKFGVQRLNVVQVGMGKRIKAENHHGSILKDAKITVPLSPGFEKR